MGIVRGDGGTWLLDEARAPGRAAEMIVRGDRVGAVEALEWGLCHAGSGSADDRSHGSQQTTPSSKSELPPSLTSDVPEKRITPWM